MRLSWNEIRARAADFAREWADAAYEKGETQSFYNEFFEIFGKRRRDVARYEERVQRLDNTSGFIDLLHALDIGILDIRQILNPLRDIRHALHRREVMGQGARRPEKGRPEKVGSVVRRADRLHALDIGILDIRQILNPLRGDGPGRATPGERTPGESRQRRSPSGSHAPAW